MQSGYLLGVLLSEDLIMGVVFISPIFENPIYLARQADKEVKETRLLWRTMPRAKGLELWRLQRRLSKVRAESGVPVFGMYA